MAPHVISSPDSEVENELPAAKTSLSRGERDARNAAISQNPEHIQKMTDIFASVPDIQRMALFLFSHLGRRFTEAEIQHSLNLRMSVAKFTECLTFIGSRLRAIPVAPALLYVGEKNKQTMYYMVMRRDLGKNLDQAKESPAVSVHQGDIVAQIKAAQKEHQYERIHAMIQRSNFQKLSRRRYDSRESYLQEMIENHMIRVCIDYLMEHFSRSVSSRQLEHAVLQSLHGMIFPPCVSIEQLLNIRSLMREFRQTVAENLDLYVLVDSRAVRYMFMNRRAADAFLIETGGRSDHVDAFFDQAPRAEEGI